MITCRPVGSSGGVERPSGVKSEDLQRPRVAREAWKKICDLFFGGKEAALAASRYIELTLRKKNGRDQAYSQLIVSRAT